MPGEEKREEYALVLDYLSTGKSGSGRGEPIAQLIGEEWFTLLEAVPKPGATMAPTERVYIGKAERDKISLIKSRITYNELTEHARSELPSLVSKIVKDKEQHFVDVFNNAGPLNIREHSLELLPGIGKKHMDAILKARGEKKFESFKDITDRVTLMQDPVKLITDRVIEELQGTGRFYMFTKPYVKKEEGSYRGRY
jgi:putative nucleotide binding protein